MSLFVDCRLATAQVRVEAARGDWVEAAAADPDGVAGAIAGTGPGTAEILLEGHRLDRMRAPQRSRAGLAVALCRLPPLPTLRVADVLLLGLRAPRPHLWQTLVGSTRARTMVCDDEAQVRALAGRLGIAEWVDVPAVDLPAHVQALTDITRAVAALPKGLVLRRPGWLPPQTVQDIRAAVREEQERDGFAVVELYDAAVADPGG